MSYECWNCKKKLSVDETQICGSCLSAKYCSKKCQQEHWETHRFTCFIEVPSLDPIEQTTVGVKHGRELDRDIEYFIKEGVAVLVDAAMLQGGGVPKYIIDALLGRDTYPPRNEGVWLGITMIVAIRAKEFDRIRPRDDKDKYFFVDETTMYVRGLPYVELIVFAETSRQLSDKFMLTAENKYDSTFAVEILTKTRAVAWGTMIQSQSTIRQGVLDFMTNPALWEVQGLVKPDTSKYVVSHTPGKADIYRAALEYQVALGVINATYTTEVAAEQLTISQTHDNIIRIAVESATAKEAIAKISAIIQAQIKKGVEYVAAATINDYEWTHNRSKVIDNLVQIYDGLRALKDVYDKSAAARMNIAIGNAQEYFIRPVWEKIDFGRFFLDLFRAPIANWKARLSIPEECVRWCRKFTIYNTNTITTENAEWITQIMARLKNLTNLTFTPDIHLAIDDAELKYFLVPGLRKLKIPLGTIPDIPIPPVQNLMDYLASPECKLEVYEGPVSHKFTGLPTKTLKKLHIHSGLTMEILSRITGNFERLTDISINTRNTAGILARIADLCLVNQRPTEANPNMISLEILDYNFENVIPDLAKFRPGLKQLRIRHRVDPTTGALLLKYARHLCGDLETVGILSHRMYRYSAQEFINACSKLQRIGLGSAARISIPREIEFASLIETSFIEKLLSANTVILEDDQSENRLPDFNGYVERRREKPLGLIPELIGVGRNTHNLWITSRFTVYSCEEFIKLLADIRRSPIEVLRYDGTITVNTAAEFCELLTTTKIYFPTLKHLDIQLNVTKLVVSAIPSDVLRYAKGLFNSKYDTLILRNQHRGARHDVEIVLTGLFSEIFKYMPSPTNVLLFTQESISPALCDRILSSLRGASAVAIGGYSEDVLQVDPKKYFPTNVFPAHKMASYIGLPKTEDIVRTKLWAL